MTKEQIIIQTGRRVRLLFWCMLILLFLSLIGLPALLGVELYLFKDNALVAGVFSLFDGLPMDDSNETVLPLSTKFFIGFFTLLLFLLYAALIWQIDKLFREYSLGHVFTETCTACFNAIGYILIAIFILSGVLDTAIPYLFMGGVENIDQQDLELFTDSNSDFAEEHDFYSVFVSLDFAYLLAGCFVIAIAKVMQLGVQLQEDADATI